MAQTEVTTPAAIRPFRVNVAEEALVDLRRRIAATRWPDRETVADRSQGVQLVPAITIASDFDGAAADGRSYARQFSGKYSHQILNGIGHNGLKRPRTPLRRRLSRSMACEVVVDRFGC